MYENGAILAVFLPIVHLSSQTGVEFAPDSPLEGDGIELSVPREEKLILRDGFKGRRRRADSTIAVRRNGAGSGAHHFRLAHLRFALMMTARAQPTTGRGGADGGDGG